MRKLFVLATLLCGLSAQAQEKASLPNVQLKDISGNVVNIQDLATTGEPLIVSFWATWCTPCKKELSNYASTLPRKKNQ